MDSILVIGAGGVSHVTVHKMAQNPNYFKNIIKTQDEFIDRFIDKVISEKPEDLVIQDKDKNNVGFLSTKKLSEILKR